MHPQRRRAPLPSTVLTAVLAAVLALLAALAPIPTDQGPEPGAAASTRR